MVGDGLHDMEFGKQLGMVTIYIGTAYDESNKFIDLRLDSLIEFSSKIQHLTPNT